MKEKEHLVKRDIEESTFKNELQKLVDRERNFNKWLDEEIANLKNNCADISTFVEIVYIALCKEFDRKFVREENSIKVDLPSGAKFKLDIRINN